MCHKRITVGKIQKIILVLKLPNAHRLYLMLHFTKWDIQGKSNFFKTTVVAW